MAFFKIDSISSVIKVSNKLTGSLWLYLLLFFFTDNPPLASLSGIAINEIGYEPEHPKLGFISSSKLDADSFFVKEARTNRTVFKGKIEKGVHKDPAVGEVVHELNFSALKKTGSYLITIPSSDLQSGVFKINSGIYNEATKTAIKSFYFQRCGTIVDNGTRWTHPACHLNDANFYQNPGKYKKVTGGWHDAGDYGKYSVNTSISLAFLLYLYDHKPGSFTDRQLNIPEAGNEVPDLLDESRWALRWLMKMQRSDGAVFHKVQKKKWTGEYLPHKDPDERYIFRVSSTATADFAAVAALGARLFESVDSAFADSLQQAAVRAWSFLEKHPKIIPDGGFVNPEDVKGGEYGDSNDRDERLWAAIELFRLTGQSKFHTGFLKLYKSSGKQYVPPVSWKNVEAFAYSSYIDMSRQYQNSEIKKLIADKIINHADELIQHVTENGYRVVLNQDEYYWGSNSVALGYAYNLIQASRLTGESQYKEAALDQLHYILGRNPFGISFITGLGKNSVKHPYHQFSIKLKTSMPVPGLVVGGPNSHNQLNDQSLSKYPGKAYEDSEKNYMVNETAINYTAPFVYLSGFFSEMEPDGISSEKPN